MSDYGSEDNDCYSEFTPCRNLQMVLDRATISADIYVTSNTLSLDYNHSVAWFPGLFDPEMHNCCLLSSSLSYNLCSLNDNLVNITCAGQYSEY